MSDGYRYGTQLSLLQTVIGTSEDQTTSGFMVGLYYDVEASGLHSRDGDDETHVG